MEKTGRYSEVLLEKPSSLFCQDILGAMRVTSEMGTQDVHFTVELLACSNGLVIR